MNHNEQRTGASTVCSELTPRMLIAWDSATGTVVVNFTLSPIAATGAEGAEGTDAEPPPDSTQYRKTSHPIKIHTPLSLQNHASYVQINQKPRTISFH